MLRRYLALALAAIALAVGLVAFAPAPRASATPVEPCATPYVEPTSGGWTGLRTFFSSEQNAVAWNTWTEKPAFQPPRWTTYQFFPAVVTLYEPCQTGPRNITFPLALEVGGEVNPDYPRRDTADFAFGADPVTGQPWTVTCRPSAGATPVVRSLSSWQGNFTDTAPGSRVTALTVTLPADCVEILRIDMTVGYRTGYFALPYEQDYFVAPSGFNPRGWVRTAVTWTATDVPYTDQAPPFLFEFCGFADTFGDSATADWCDTLVPPADLDPLDLDDTCNNPANEAIYGAPYAVFDPLDNSTWAPAVQWNLSCLFIPIGGLDRAGIIQQQWNLSPNSELASAFGAASSSWQFSATCGPLFSLGASSPIGVFAIDTCTLGWFAPVRDLLGWGIVALGAWFFISRFFGLIASLLKFDNPIKDDDK